MRVFCKTVSAAAVECCEKIILIPETIVYPWRERLGMGVEGHIVSKMYCFTEQSEAVGGWLVFVCLVGFLLLLFSLILLICPLSAFLYIYFQFPRPPLAEEQETRLSSVS